MKRILKKKSSALKVSVSLLLTVILIISTVVTVSAYTVWPSSDSRIEVLAKTSDEALAEYEAANGVEVPTNRYYFQMPDGVHGMRGKNGNVASSWYNAYTQGAGVYWWGFAPAACEAWTGYQAMTDDAAQHIYYVNMPKQTVAFVWNNGIDGTMDEEYPLYYLTAHTVDVPSEYPDPGEYTTMPEGADSFDECIFIVDPDAITINPLSNRQTCGGTWYFYYGDGCYGKYAKGSGKDKCCNPDHYYDADVSGEHIGFLPTIDEPTDAPPEPLCSHSTTYTVEENFQYYHWGYAFEVVTYCSQCNEELDRVSVEVENPTEAPCSHSTTYTVEENFQYYHWGYTFEVVTYCSQCNEELDRVSVEVENTTDEPIEEPTEKPIHGSTYYLTGSIAGWGLDANYELTATDNKGEYSISGVTLTTADMIKAIKSSKSGTEISDWYPDGMDNNITVDTDSTYTILFRPNGDGTAEDGWIYSCYVGEQTFGGANEHGGYLFKLIDENAKDKPTEEPTDEPTDAPTEPPCPHEYTYTKQVNYKYYDWGYTYEEVTYCDWCNQEVSRNTVEHHYQVGDVDGDETITILDATRIQRYLAELSGIDGAEYRQLSTTDLSFRLVDVDGDGRISVFDALRIQCYLAKMCKLDGSPYDE